MAKRRASDAFGDERQTKRIRAPVTDRLSKLSDELILRVLSFLPLLDLIVSERVSQKFHALAGDSQLWKALYYNRFVRPRASRIPGIRDSGIPADSLHFSSKLSRWLDDECLVKRGKETNWKRQYKLRHNWSRGSCIVSEVPVAEQASIPPVLVQMHESTIYLADQKDGLRAWSSKVDRGMLSRMPLSNRGKGTGNSFPTALAVDTSAGPEPTNVAICFQDGSFSLYRLDHDTSAFSHQYTHEPSSNGMLTAISISYPYLVTMAATQILSVYKFETQQDTESKNDILDPPRLLQSLHSHTVWPPLTLSIRPSTSNILVSIAYSLPTYLSGWTVGIQEMRMTLTGDIVSTRLASAIDQHFRPLVSSIPSTPPSDISTPTTPAPFTYSEANQIHSKPTSLSYSHPYLLVSHPDNTLTLYMVSSTAESLSISPGSRLWGHTSSVSGAHVGGRGKAVSVSSRGDELRVWELEGGFGSAASRRKLASGASSVQIRPERRADMDCLAAVAARRDGFGLALDLEDGLDEVGVSRGWVGFDEENVVVLREKGCGGQALMVYDFT